VAIGRLQMGCVSLRSSLSLSYEKAEESSV
jgi:hypothetical protein